MPLRTIETEADLAEGLAQQEDAFYRYLVRTYLGRDHEALGRLHRITSYNVCYTKLLRNRASLSMLLLPMATRNIFWKR